jgi:sirohydrochlorin cobaltochelatase
LAPLPTTQDRDVIVLLGHGSREQRSNSEFEHLADCLRQRWQPREIIHAYIELAQPSLPHALREAASRADRVVVLPCFLFAAGHVKNDLPLELFRARRDFSTVRFLAAQALGIHVGLIGAALDRLKDCPSQSEQRRALVVVGRGSSDPDANGDFAKLVRLIGEAAGVPEAALPAFIGITKPSFSEALDAIARRRPEEITVLPYFLFAGRLIDRLESELAEFGKTHPWIRTTRAPHLGLHDGVFRALDERLYQVLAGTGSLPCDTCQYRVPISPIASDVGGLKALLWSVRHITTHSQAMPHLHAHKPMRKHVLVCGNVDCASRGSVMLAGTLRRLLKRAGHEQSVKVTKTGCMGRCGEGPTVAVYPDGIWYRGVKVEDAPELVEEHLVNDRLVARLVDAIMQ